MHANKLISSMLTFSLFGLRHNVPKLLHHLHKLIIAFSPAKCAFPSLACISAFMKRGHCGSSRLGTTLRHVLCRNWWLLLLSPAHGSMASTHHPRFEWHQPWHQLVVWCVVMFWLGYPVIPLPGLVSRRWAATSAAPVSYTHLTLPTNREV